MANTELKATNKYDGITIRAGCKNFTFTHKIGQHSKRVNDPLTAKQKSNWAEKSKAYKANVTAWAAGGGEGKAPTKPKKPVTKYHFEDYIGFGISCRLGYDTVHVKANDILELANSLLDYYERVGELEETATEALKELDALYKEACAKGECTENKAKVRPTLQNVRDRANQLTKKKVKAPKKKVA